MCLRYGLHLWLGAFLLPAADAVESAVGVILATDVVDIPALRFAFRFGFLYRCAGVRIQPCPHGSADAAYLWTLHAVAFVLLDLRGGYWLAACGYFFWLHWCRALLPAEAHLVAIFVYRDSYPLTGDSCCHPCTAGIYALGVGCH